MFFNFHDRFWEHVLKNTIVVEKIGLQLMFFENVIIKLMKVEKIAVSGTNGSDFDCLLVLNF